MYLISESLLVACSGIIPRSSPTSRQSLRMKPTHLATILSGITCGEWEPASCMWSHVPRRFGYLFIGFHTTCPVAFPDRVHHNHAVVAHFTQGKGRIICSVQLVGLQTSFPARCFWFILH